MFKKTFYVLLAVLVIAAFVFVPKVMANKKPPVSPQLNPGSDLFAYSAKESAFFRIKMDAGVPTDVVKIPVNMPGRTLDGAFAVTPQQIIFAWAKDGQLYDLWSRNASSGFELKQLTNTPDIAEYDPAVCDGTLYYTRLSGISEIYYTSPDGRRVPQFMAKNAAGPACAPHGPVTWEDLTNGTISIWGAQGHQHSYIPDRSGIAVQKDGRFYLWLNYGVPYDFGNYKALAFQPSGNLAAVVTENGDLMIVRLDPTTKVPVGEPTRIMLNENIVSVQWIEVK